MSLWRRKPVRVLVIVLAVLLVLVAAVKIFLPAEKIRDLALAQARERLGREVTVDGVSVSLKGGLGVRLTDLAVHNPDGFPGDPFLQAGSFDLKLALGPLLKKQVQITRLVLDRPALNLAVDSDGNNNFTFAQPESEAAAGGGSESGSDESAPLAVTIPTLTVSNGSVVYADARAANTGVGRVQVNDLSVNVTLDSTPDGGLAVRGNAKASDIAVTGPQSLPALATEADFDITWQPEPAAVALNSVTARINGVPLNGAGQVDLSGPAPTGTINLTLPEQPLTDLLVFAPAKVTGKITGSNDSGRINAVVEVTLTGNQENPVHTAGQATLRDVDLGLAQPFLPPEKGATVAGRGDAEFTFALDSPDPDQLAYTGTATVRGVSYSQPDLMDQLQNLDGELLITPDEFTVLRCRAQFAAGTFDLTGSLHDPLPYFLPPELQAGKTMKTPHLEFALSTERLDVDTLLPAASPASEKDAAQGTATGSGSAGRTPPPPIEFEFPDITGQGTLAADSLFYMQMPFTGLAGKIRLVDRVMECYDLQGGLYGGTVGGDVSIDLKDLNAPAYASTYRATNIEVDRFLDRFIGLSGVVYGGVGLQGSFSARGRDPETIKRTLTMDSDAGIRQGRVVTSGNTYTALSQLAGQLGQTLEPEQTLRDLATHIQVEGGKIGLKDLSTRLGQVGDLTFGGTVAFTGELDYSGQILLTEEATARIFTGGTLGELGKLLGDQQPERLALPLSVGGSRTSPKVQFDLGAVAADLQNRVIKEQGQKLEDEAKSKLKDLWDKLK